MEIKIWFLIFLTILTIIPCAIGYIIDKVADYLDIYPLSWYGEIICKVISTLKAPKEWLSTILEEKVNAYNNSLK